MKTLHTYGNFVAFPHKEWSSPMPIRYPCTDVPGSGRALRPSAAKLTSLGRLLR